MRRDEVERTKSYYLTKLRKREPLVPSAPWKPPSKTRAEKSETADRHGSDRHGADRHGADRHVSEERRMLQERDQRIAELEERARVEVLRRRAP